MCDFSVKKKTKVSYCIEISEDTRIKLDQLCAEHDAECERNEKYDSYDSIIQFILYSIE